MRKNQVRVRGILTLTLALTLFFVPTAPALAVITLWTGAAQDGGNWDTAGNWTNGVPASSDSVYINNDGTAANISGPASASTIDIGANDNNVSGTLNIDGSSAKLDMLDGLAYIGYDVPDGNNYGEVNLKNGGKFDVGHISLGVGGEGIITINGTGSKLTVSDMLFPDPAYAGIALIGSNGGSGTLNLTGGGTADITYLSLGSEKGEGAITIDGTGSKLTVGDYANIGAGGKGAMTLQGGGAVDVVGFLYLGYDTSYGLDAAGTLIVDDSTLLVGGDAWIGMDGGEGEITLRNGGTADVVGGLILGDDYYDVGYDNGQETAGALTIDGAGSKLTTGGDVIIGSYGGKGEVTLKSDGMLDAGSNKLVLGDAGGKGTLNLGDGTGKAGLVKAAEINGSGIAADNRVLFNHTATKEAAHYFTDDSTETGAFINLTGALGVENKTGVTVLTGANTYSGDTTVSGGTLRIGDGQGNGVLGFGATNSYAGDISIAEGAFMEFHTTTGQELTGNITGPGTLAVLKDASVAYNTGAISSKLALYEGSSFGFLGGTNNVPLLEVRGKNAEWRGDLAMGAGKTINFYVPDTLAAEETMLKIVAGTGTGSAAITGATIGVGIDGAAPALQIGETITLIEAAAPGLLESDHDGKKAEAIAGISTVYSFDLQVVDARKLQATRGGGDGGGDGDGDGDGDSPTETHVEEQLKSLPEGQVAGVGLLSQGADLVSGQGLGQLRTQTVMGIPGPATFGVTSGGSLRYNSGSHVDVSGFSLSTGVGWNFPVNGGANGDLLLGAFFEAGWSSYDSHNSFVNAPSIHGKGDTKYYGGGVMARYDTKPIGPGHLYFEGSVRAGRVESDYQSSDFLTASGNKARYDSSAPYHGLHAGLGYIWNFAENTNLDVYAKYLWTHQGGDSVTMEGDRIEFKTIDSHRLRAGARLNHILNTASGLSVAPYIGAAYDHEFDSQANSTVNGRSIKAPEVKGGTGMGEIGFVWKPSPNLPLSFDLGAQGYTGKREGVTGSLTINLVF